MDKQEIQAEIERLQQRFLTVVQNIDQLSTSAENQAAHVLGLINTFHSMHQTAIEALEDLRELGEEVASLRDNR